MNSKDLRDRVPITTRKALHALLPKITANEEEPEREMSRWQREAQQAKREALQSAASLSWHVPGKTALIVLADPALLAAGRENRLQYSN